MKANDRHSHQNLKVVEVIGFCESRYEIESVFNLVEDDVSLEKLIIHVYSLLEILNQIAKAKREFVELFKTQICLCINAVILLGNMYFDTKSYIVWEQKI